MVKIIQITDCHLGKSRDFELVGVNTYASVKKVIDSVQQERPDFVIGSGDLSEDASMESYVLLKEMLSHLSVPYHLFAGNHDSPDLVKTVFGKQGQSNVKLNFENWTIILANSVVEKESHGLLNDEAIDFISKSVHISENIGIFMHHHPVPVGNPLMNRYSLLNSNDFMQEIRGNERIKFVAFGHIHHEFNTQKEGVQYFGSPAASLQFRGDIDGVILDHEKGPGYTIFNLTKDGFERTVKML